MNEIYLQKALDLVEMSIDFFEQKKESVFPYRNSFYALFFTNKEIDKQFIEILPTEALEECIEFISFLSSISSSLNDTMCAHGKIIKNTDIKNFLCKLKKNLEKAGAKRFNHQIDKVSSLSSEHPKVFISYSWEDPEHSIWVKSLADHLIADGIDAILDQYDLSLGDRLPQFMEESIAACDYVLIACTPTYKEKSNLRRDGVGYEGHIISEELMSNRNERKFIPLIRKGTKQTALPTCLSGKLFIDFTKENDFKISDKYIELIKTLYMIQKKPPLGKKPQFLEEQKFLVVSTNSNPKDDSDALKTDVKKYSLKIDYDSGIDSDILDYFEKKYFSSDNSGWLLPVLWNGAMIEEDKTGVLFFHILKGFISRYTTHSEKYFSEHSEDLFKIIDIEAIIEKENWNKNAVNKFARAVLLFFQYPNLYNSLTDANKISFKIKCKENLNYYLVSYYCDSDLSIHFEQCKELLAKNARSDQYALWGDYSKFDIDAVILVRGLAEIKSELNKYNEFVINNVINRSLDYSRCEAVLEKLLPVFISKFTKENILNIIKIFSVGQYATLGGSEYGKTHYDTWHYIKKYVPTIINSVGKDDLLHSGLDLAKRICNA